MTPAPTQKHIGGNVFLEPEVFSNGADLHAIGSHAANVAHDAFRKFCFVVALASGLAAGGYCMGVIFGGGHPFKVFDTIIEFVKVPMIDCVPCNSNWTGRIADKSQSDQNVYSDHSFGAFALKQDMGVIPDGYRPKFSASASYSTAVADFVVSGKRSDGYWFPLHAALYLVFPWEVRQS